MGYASIEDRASHCQNSDSQQRHKCQNSQDMLDKAYELARVELLKIGATDREIKIFNQRLKYRLEQGLSFEEAYLLASAKLRLVPIRTAENKRYFRPSFKLVAIDENSSDASSSGNFRPGEEPTPKDENSSESAKPSISVIPEDPDEDEVRALVEELKTKGLMTELPSPEIVSEAGGGGRAATSSAHVEGAEKEPDFGALNWIVAAFASVWLTIAMVRSLDGNPVLNLLVAISFSFAPLLILAPKLSASDQSKARWGAGLIFALDVLLYLLPSAQVLWNESAEYLSARETYVIEAKQFEAERSNDTSLLAAAQTRSDEAKKAFDDALKDHGPSSWRTATAKKDYEQKFAAWSKQSENSKIARNEIAPAAPKLSQAMTEAAQALAIRIGLFLVVYYLMFVRRQRI